MHRERGEGNGFLSSYAKNWINSTAIVYLDQEILNIRKILIVLCDNYLKKLTGSYEIGVHSTEVLKRRRVLGELKSLSEEGKNTLWSKLPLVIFLFKAYEELFLHGLRSCQRYILEIVNTEKLISSIDKEIVGDVELKSVLKRIDSLIGQYLEEYESVTHFFKRLDSITYSTENICKKGNYCHPKFKYLENIVTKYFQAFPNSKAIIFCESSFYMLEICNFLLNLQPLVKPMIYIHKEKKNGSAKENFSQEAKQMVKKMFGSGQFNVLVRACSDIEYMDLDEVELLVHFDVEQHFLTEIFLNSNNKAYNYHKVELLFPRREIQKIMSMKNVLSDLDVNSMDPILERKEKISELSNSKPDKYYTEKKLRSNQMGDTYVGFDSFELDDRFLSKLDAEIGKVNTGQNSVVFHSSMGNNLKDLKKEESLNNTEEVKKKYYDLPLSVDDLSELNCNFKVKIEENGLPKVPKTTISNSNNQSINSNEIVFETCVSPILGKLPLKSGCVSSSTPLRKVSNISTTHQQIIKEEEENKCEETAGDNMKNVEYGYIDFDLFEDWDKCGAVEKNSQESKSLITISQAVELVEEVKKSSEVEKHLESDEDELNDSIDLLTGNRPRQNVESIENLFAESFDLSKLESVEKKNKLQYSSGLKKEVCNTNQSIILDFGNSFENTINTSKNKPAAAHRLNFEDIEIEQEDSDKERNSKTKMNPEIESDESFDAVIQISFLDRIKMDDTKASSNNSLKVNKNIAGDNCPTPMCGVSTIFESKVFDLGEDSLNLCNKRGRYNRIIDSESDGDSPSQKFCKKKKNSEEAAAREDLLDLEADVSDDINVSSDEMDDEKDEYEKSFVDDKSYYTQNASVEMTAKYLESVKTTNNRPGTFKIPKQLPYIMEDIVSQISNEDNSDYEIDSFCVNDVEFEDKELSDLEIAEQILELDKRNEKKKNKTRSKKRKF